MIICDICQKMGQRVEASSVQITVDADKCAPRLIDLCEIHAQQVNEELGVMLELLIANAGTDSPVGRTLIPRVWPTGEYKK